MTSYVFAVCLTAFACVVDLQAGIDIISVSARHDNAVGRGAFAAQHTRRLSQCLHDMTLAPRDSATSNSQAGRMQRLQLPNVAILK